MNILPKWAKTVKTLRPYTQEETVAYSLPVVLRVEKTNPPTHEEALLAMADAMLQFYNAEKVYSGEWRELVNLWMDGRIRKVVRRARGAAYLKLENEDHIKGTYTNGDKTVEVIILPPHRVDEIPATIRGLQVSGLDLERAPNTVTATKFSGLNIAFHPELTMSTGKTMAQMGHAVQLAIMSSAEDVLVRWVEKGCPIRLVDWNYTQNWDVEVQDAGLTEIPAGSFTVKTVFTL